MFRIFNIKIFAILVSVALQFFDVPISFGQQNTILIIADDLSPDYLSCFSTITDTATTPILNNLAAEGIKFTKVWSSPVCSPARASILTGRYPFRTGVGGVITNAASPQLDTSEISLAKLLKYYAPIPYKTACIGKWHLHNNQPNKRLNPNKMGFDFYSGNFNGAIADYYNYPIVTNGILGSATTYATTETVNTAISWLDSLNPTQPFFLWLAFNAPHSPFHLPPPHLCDTSGLTGSPNDIATFPKKYFKAALQALDSELGRLLFYLDNNNLLDSTNIIFIGDNGNQQEVAQISNPLQSKGTIFDYGVRVPLIIKGPMVNSTNSSNDELVSAVDLFATILEVSGFTNWSNTISTTIPIDSKSMVSLLTQQPAPYRSWIFSETFNQPATSNDGKTIRNAAYHLLRFDNGIEKFYNQSVDQEEINDLLMNPNQMTPTDLSNYNTLCDTLAMLVNTSGCSTNTITNHFSNSVIRIYPNPTNDLLYVSVNSMEEFSMRLINTIGSEIPLNQVSDTGGDQVISLKELTNGLYFLQFTSEHQTAHMRVVVSK